jgi:hypothetical protein
MATRTRAKLRKATYEKVARNIERVTSPSGTTFYRVRVQRNGEKASGTAYSLKAAKQLKAEFVG